MALITYEDKEDINITGILEKYKITAENMNEIKRALNENLYSIGSIYVTSTNTNPGDILGGTWELVDKGFSSRSFDASDNIATPTANVTDFGCFVVRSGHSFALRFDFKNHLVINQPKHLQKVDTILNNSFGMLGIHSVVIVKRYNPVG